MSKREARALQQASAEGPSTPSSRLRWGRGRTTMSDEGAANTGVSQTPDGRVSETAVMARREGNNPEVITLSGTSNTEVHQLLLEQVARLRELLSGKEAELAEVKSGFDLCPRRSRNCTARG